LKKNTRYYFPIPQLLLLICILFYKCANKVSLSGGIKDENAPKLEYSFPDSEAVNFHNNEITLHFDEYVKLNNFQSEFISSPPLKTLPDYQIKGKSIILKIKDELADSTTYILDFGNSIQDITEGNTLKNFQFAFSTGPFIDSLKISGDILNAFDLKPEKNIAIMLYANLNDTAPRKILPNYYSKSNDNGSFSLPYLKEGAYQIFALFDANSNFVFDLPTEKIAFTDSLVYSGKADSIKLYLFEEDHTKFYLKTVNADEYGKILFVFSLPADSAQIKHLHSHLPENWKMEEWSARRDSLIYWIPDSIIDTLNLQVRIDTLTDTLNIAMPLKNPLNETSRRSRRIKEFKLSVTSNISSSVLDLNKDVVINFSHPIKSYDSLQIILVENKDTLIAESHFSDSFKRRLIISRKWKEETDYSIFISDSIFKDIFGLYNDTIQYHFKTKAVKQYGTAQLNIVFGDSMLQPFIIQLLNEKGTLIREDYMLKATKIKYEYLNPGNYTLKAIEDRNGNNKWDTGNFDKRLLAEKVLKYNTALTIRANWDIELEWPIP
jgi:hypothetical protein